MFRDHLREWFATHGDWELPWRMSKVTPWQVLLSEILLQRTDVPKVIPVYQQIVGRFEAPQDMCAAGDELDRIIARIGLVSRASRLRKMACTIQDQFFGRVPDTVDDLLTLPGIGPYTANAVLCFAYNQAVPVVDSNVFRVLRRVFSLDIHSKRDPQRNKKVLDFAGNLVPTDWAREYNMAIIDFGRLVCTAKRPKCAICPFVELCDHLIGGCGGDSGALSLVQRSPRPYNPTRGCDSPVHRAAPALGGAAGGY